MSEIDRIFAEREARRLEKERARRERFEVAAAFVQEFFERDVAPSQALAKAGIEATLTADRILLHRADAGIYADAFQIAVGQDGAIDIAGRSLGPYEPDNKVKLRRELIDEILTFFDL